MNIHSEQDRLRLMVSCTYIAVQTGFQHISIRDLVDPPHCWQDALFARQIVVRILSRSFWIPQRRIAALLNRNGTTISIAVGRVSQRMDDPVFEAAYTRLAERATDLYQSEMRSFVEEAAA